MKPFIDIQRIVAAKCSDHPEIAAAYIFGSAVTERLGAKSDIDVAVLLNPSQQEMFALLSFMSDLDRLLGCRADVTVLNRAGEVLKYEVRRTGRLIYEKNTDLRKRFEILGRKTLEDYLHIHKRYADKVIYGGKNGQSAFGRADSR